MKFVNAEFFIALIEMKNSEIRNSSKQQSRKNNSELAKKKKTDGSVFL